MYVWVYDLWCVLLQVSRVEGILLQVQKSQCEDEVNGLLQEVNTLLPVRITEPDSKNKLVSQKLDLCQVTFVTIWIWILGFGFFIYFFSEWVFQLNLSIFAEAFNRVCLKVCCILYNNPISFISILGFFL